MLRLDSKAEPLACLKLLDPVPDLTSILLNESDVFVPLPPGNDIQEEDVVILPVSTVRCLAR